MNKKVIAWIAVLLLMATVAVAGCSAVTPAATEQTDDLSKEAQPAANDPNSAPSDPADTGSNASDEALKAATDKYQEIIDRLTAQNATLERRILDLETTVRHTISAGKTHIGGYAAEYADCVLNLYCKDSRYISTSSGGNIGCRGTGFIITEDGYLLTNNHVVSYSRVTVWDGEYKETPYGWVGAEKLVSGQYDTIKGYFDDTSIYYEDCKGYEIQVVYRNSDYDLALCKIVTDEPKTDWKAIPFYEEEVVRGDELIALGNAHGFGLSATTGIVSATGKTFNDTPELTFIQTDTAINGGNSGGPVLNLFGGLVGIANCKFVGSNIDCIAFAIEIDKIEAFITLAESKKEITVSYTTVAAPEAEPTAA